MLSDIIYSSDEENIDSMVADGSLPEISLGSMRNQNSLYARVHPTNYERSEMWISGLRNSTSQIYRY